MTRTQTRLIIAAATLVLFCFANWRMPLRNEDSALYILLAERIAGQGMAGAFELYDRPFFSALIAAIHLVSGLDPMQAALMLNLGLSLLLVLAFAEFCCVLHGDERLRPWAALVLLAHPKLVNTLPLLIRDPGYWALLLLSLCSLQKYVISGAYSRAAIWAGCILGAALFKPEALAWGLLLPLGLPLVVEGGTGRRLRLSAVALALVVIPAVLLSVGFSRGFAHISDAAPDLWTVPAQVFGAVQDGFLGASARYADVVLDPQSRHVAALSLAGGLAMILVAKVLNALGPLQLLLLVWGPRAALAGPAVQRRLFVILMFPALLLPAVFLGYRQFLDTRYVFPLVLLLLAWVAPVARALCTRLGLHMRSRPAVAVMLVCSVFALDLALGLDRPKPYLVDCVRWLQREIPPETRLFSNDVQLALGSGARWDWAEAHHADRLFAEGWRPQDARIVVIHERPDRAPVPDLQTGMAHPLREIRRFEGERGALIRVLEPALP